MLCLDDLQVPIENLTEGAPVAQAFPGQVRVGVVRMPELPLEILELAIDTAACGSIRSPRWGEACERLGPEFTPAQWADLASWATTLMPNFGLPSEAHAGLFAHASSDVLNTRLGAYHPTPWSYGIMRWNVEGGSHICIVAIQRSFLRAEARVSEIYHIEDDEYEDLAFCLAKGDLIKRLLGVTASRRRHLSPEESISASWRPTT